MDRTTTLQHKPEDDDLVPTGVRLPSALLKTARKAAIDRETTLQQLCADGLRLLLQKELANA
jgi:hypothetical protein